MPFLQLIKKNIFTLFIIQSLLLLATYTNLRAQTFEASPQSIDIQANEFFSIQYTIENTDVKEFIPPQIPKELEIVSGPEKSSNVQIINGRMTSSMTLKYTLKASAQGNYTIQPAKVTVGKKKLLISSSPIKVTITNAPQNTTTPNTQTTPQANNEDIFLKLELNPATQVVKGQQITATYKLFSAIEILDYSPQKIPNFTGFVNHNISSNNVVAKGITRIGGKEYTEYEIMQYALFPQKAGKLTITAPTVHIEGYAPGSRLLRKNVTIPTPTDIFVQDLPQPAPPNFSGAVGDYSLISATLSKTTTQANQPIELQLQIQGTGDIKTIQAPTIPITQHLETFDPKIIDDIRKINNLMGGIKTLTYSIIPTQEGRYTIPIQFIFYSTKTNKYETLTPTQPLEISVQPSTNDTTQQVTSFRDTTSTPPSLPTQLKTSVIKIIALLAILASVLWLFKRFKKNQKTETPATLPPLLQKKQTPPPPNTPAPNNAPTTTSKYTAEQVLNTIKPLQHNPSQFYTETLHQLKHYFETNLNIPKNTFTQETLKQNLENKQANPELIQNIIHIVSHIQEQLYAPHFLQNPTQQTYELIQKHLPNINKTL